MDDDESSKGNVPSILTKFLKRKMNAMLSGYLRKFDLNKVKGDYAVKPRIQQLY